MTTLKAQIALRRFAIMKNRSHPTVDQHQASTDRHFFAVNDHMMQVEIGQRWMNETLEAIEQHLKTMSRKP